MEKERNRCGASIGCTVTSCRYNGRGTSCELDHIEVRPCRNGNCGTGSPDDESSCGSYVKK